MFQDHAGNLKEMQEFAALGSDAIAYMREISTEEIKSAFPNTPELEEGHLYWALFAADGSPLVLADSREEITSSAFYNDLSAVLPN